MAKELVYTSVPRGLQPGKSGFCVAAATATLEDIWIRKLPDLTAYAAVAPLHGKDAHQNPVNYLYINMNLPSQPPRRVFARISACDPDYTGRSNKIAHFIIADYAECPDDGPAALLSRENFTTAWLDQPKALNPRRLKPSDKSGFAAHNWRSIFNDSGMAGAPLDAFFLNPKKPIYFVMNASVNLLELLKETFSLLPPERRWDIPFCTYFVNLPQDITCPWRGILKGSEFHKIILQKADFGQVEVVDFIDKTSTVSTSGEWAERARTGKITPSTESTIKTVGRDKLELRAHTHPKIKDEITEDDLIAERTHGGQEQNYDEPLSLMSADKPERTRTMNRPMQCSDNSLYGTGHGGDRDRKLGIGIFFAVAMFVLGLALGGGLGWFVNDIKATQKNAIAKAELEKERNNAKKYSNEKEEATLKLDALKGEKEKFEKNVSELEKDIKRIESEKKYLADKNKNLRDENAKLEQKLKSSAGNTGQKTKTETINDGNLNKFGDTIASIHKMRECYKKANEKIKKITIPCGKDKLDELFDVLTEAKNSGTEGLKLPQGEGDTIAIAIAIVDAYANFIKLNDEINKVKDRWDAFDMSALSKVADLVKCVDKIKKAEKIDDKEKKLLEKLIENLNKFLKPYIEAKQSERTLFLKKSEEFSKYYPKAKDMFDPIMKDIEKQLMEARRTGDVEDKCLRGYLKLIVELIKHIYQKKSSSKYNDWLEDLRKELDKQKDTIDAKLNPKKSEPL